MAAKKDPDDPQELIARKEYKKAVAVLRERLAKNPKNGNLRLNLADVLLTSGQPEEAIKEYKNLAILLTDEGFIVKAIAVYKKILKLSPGLEEVEIMLSDLSDKRSSQDRPRKPIIPMAAQKEPEKPPPPSPFLEIETKLFKGLKADEFRDIVAKLSLRHFEEDTIVVKEGDPGDSMFIIVRGEVRVLTKGVQKSEVSLANLGEGEFFGEISLLTGKPRTATIITTIDSELLELTRKDYEGIIARFPRVKGVMQEFHEQRAYKTIEAIIQSKRQ